MMSCKKGLSGYTTVFLSLLITIFLSLFATILYSSIHAGKKVLAENTVDISISSLFGKFNQKLLEDYDLFYIDIQDIKRGLSKKGLAMECRDMAIHHINYDTNISGVLGYVDLLKLDLPEITCKKYSLATDEKGKVYRQQVIHYMKAAYPNTLLNLLKEFTRDSEYGKNIQGGLYLGESTSGVIQSKNAFSVGEKKNSDSETKLPKVSQVEEYKISPDLLGYINLIKSGGILKFVWTKPLSIKGVDKNLYIGKRTLKNNGDGMYKDYGYKSVDSKLLFNEYLLEHFGNALDPIPDRALQYEIEYILCGKESDSGNLKSTAYRLLALREAANGLYIISDAVKRTEAEKLGMILATLLGAPEAAELMGKVVIATWAFGESMLDLKELFSGKKVPVIKSSKSFKLQINNITNIFSQKYTSCNEPTALDYRGYLRLLLLLGSSDKHTLNSMDLIEANMRLDRRYQDFRMDACVEWVEFDFIFYINKEIHYVRKYGYVQ